ncbi:hypothetical protein LTR95_006847 [Oleoguttula sp. CCFEE 5521]
MARLELNGLRRALVAVLAVLALCLMTGPITSGYLYAGDEKDGSALESGGPSHALYSASTGLKASAQAIRRAEDSGPEDSDSEGSESDLAAPVEFTLTEEEKTTAYHDYGCRGASLLGILHDPTKHTQSSWTHFSDIASWGWRINAESTAEGVPLREYGLKNALDSIGASEDEPPNNNIRWVHDIQTTHRDGTRDVVYPTTGAYYENVINVRDGVIIAYDVQDPATLTGSVGG